MFRIPKEYEPEIDIFLHEAESNGRMKFYDSGLDSLNRALAYHLIKRDTLSYLDANTKYRCVFPTEQDMVIVRRSDSKEDNTFQFNLDGVDYLCGPGLYFVVGAAGYGKSSLIDFLINENREKDWHKVLAGESNQGLSDDWSTLSMTGSALDIVSLSAIFENVNQSYLVIDSLTFLLSFNQGAGIEVGGLPSRPFQVFKALNQAAEWANKIAIVTLVVRPAREEMTKDLTLAYFNRLKGDANGVFLPNVVNKNVSLSLRYELNSKERILHQQHSMPSIDREASVGDAGKKRKIEKRDMGF